MEPVQKPATMREIKASFRMERHREFLTTALDMVAEDGLDALTMQGLADALGCGIATLYVHFPSKTALVAELQREALDILSTSLQIALGHLDDLLARIPETGADTASLAPVVAATRFWTSAESVYREEAVLCHKLLTQHEPGGDEERAIVTPAVLRLLSTFADLLADAGRRGGLAPGDESRRAFTLVAGTTGILGVGVSEHLDEDAPSRPERADAMVADLLTAWGATAPTLAEAERLVATLEDRGRLVVDTRH